MFKKGFTLVELLAVIIILGVIIAIIVPVTNSIINNSKQSAYDSQIDLLVDQALKYSVTNDLGTENGVQKTLQFEDLISDGLIQTHPENPITGGELEGCIVYSWESSINQYVFSYSETCTLTITENALVDGHEFNLLIKSLIGYSTATQIDFENTITTATEGAVATYTEIFDSYGYPIEPNEENVKVDLSLSQDKSIIGFIEGDTIKIQSNGVIKIYENTDFFYAEGMIMRYSMFSNMDNITTIDFNSNFDTSDVTNMSGMFYGASSLTSLDLSSFNTSNVINMRYMFGTVDSLTSLDLSSFDTSNVTDMSEMFYSASGLITLDLSSFDVSNVTNMSYMLSWVSNLTTLYVKDQATGNLIKATEEFPSGVNVVVK